MSEWMEEAKDDKVRGRTRLLNCKHRPHGVWECKVAYDPKWYDCANCPEFTPKPKDKA